MQYLIAFCTRLEAAIDDISGRFVWSIVPDRQVKFCYSRTNRSREMPPEAVGGSIFEGFIRDNIRPEVASEVISGVKVEQVGVNVRVILGGSGSNFSRDIPYDCLTL